MATALPIIEIEDLAGWNMVYGDAAKQDMLYVVEVYAKWCGSSKACLSTYKKLVEEYVEQQKKVRLCRVCADVTSELATKDPPEEDPLAAYKVDALPRFLMLVNGQQVGAITGISMPNLEKMIAANVPDGLLEDEVEEEEETGADDE